MLFSCGDASTVSMFSEETGALCWPFSPGSTLRRTCSCAVGGDGRFEDDGVVQLVLIVLQTTLIGEGYQEVADGLGIAGVVGDGADLRKNENTPSGSGWPKTAITDAPISCIAKS